MNLMAEHVRGLARLAGDLLGDAGAGEDVAQDAAVRALRADRRPRDAEGQRRWLHAIGRRLIADEWRRRARREERERVAQDGAPVSFPSSEELAERAELAELLHGRVRALAPELRAVLLDRYIGDLTPNEIAARDGVSPFTVKARLRRAKAALRADLERRGFDGPRPWMSALAPLAASPTGSTGVTHAGALSAFTAKGLVAHATLTLGVLSMTKALAAAGLAASAALLGFILLSGDGPDEDRDRATTSPPDQGDELAGITEAEEGVAVDEPAPIDAGRVVAETAPDGGLVVHVRTEEGRPVDQFPVAIRLEGLERADAESLRGRTDSEGVVRIPNEDVQRIRDQRPDTPLIVGLGTDTHAPVEVQLSSGPLPEDPVVLTVDMMRVTVWAVTPDGERWTGGTGLNIRPDGMHYYTNGGPPPRIGWVPRGRGYTARVYGCGLWLDSEEQFPAPLPDEHDREHLIMLEDAISGITGRFVYPSGAAVAEGRHFQANDRNGKWDGSRPVVVGEDGAFSFPLRAGESPGAPHLFVFYLGGKNGEWTGRARFDVGAPGEYLDVGDIVLERQPLLVSGRVTTPDGVRQEGTYVHADYWIDGRGWRQNTDVGGIVRADESGHFELFAPDPGGLHRLKLAMLQGEKADLVPSASLEFEPGATDLEFALVAPGGIEARLDAGLATAGNSKAALVVHVDPDGASPEFELERRDVAPYGQRFDVDRIPPGQVRIELLAGPGGAPLESWGRSGWTAGRSRTSESWLDARRTPSSPFRSRLRRTSRRR